MRDVIFDDENIIGYSDDIALALLDDSDDELIHDLIDVLSTMDFELVKCVYNPMGCYTVYKLIDGESITV